MRMLRRSLYAKMEGSFQLNSPCSPEPGTSTTSSTHRDTCNRTEKAENAFKTFKQLYIQVQAVWTVSVRLAQCPDRRHKDKPRGPTCGSKWQNAILRIAGRLLHQATQRNKICKTYRAGKKGKHSTTTRVPASNRWSQSSQEKQFVFDYQDKRCGQQAFF